MSWARNGMARIYWEEEGAGEPLLLIMGLSMSLGVWGELRTFLAQRFRTILFDNRCAGASNCPVVPFRVATMARDAVAVMDAAGVDKAQVVGISMGGMIAQELTLRCPDRVTGLVLGCTHAGGPTAVFADTRVLSLLASPAMKADEKLEAMVPYLYHPNTPRERAEKELRIIRANAPSLRGYLQQIAAILSWSAYRRLPRINVPTLVIHGDSDLLVPTENARILARRIPGAELVILPDAAHMFPTDQPELTRSILSAFLHPSSLAA